MNVFFSRKKRIGIAIFTAIMFLSQLFVFTPGSVVKAAEENLVTNGSFADEMDGWYVATRDFYYQNGAIVSGDSWDHQRVDNGDGTFDIMSGEALLYDNVIVKNEPQFYVSSDDSQDGDGKCMRPFIFGYADWREMNQQIMNVKPNTEYEFSFYHKGDSTLIIELIDWSKSEGNVKFQLNDGNNADWTKYSAKITTSDNPNMWLYIKNNSWPGAAAYFDNFQVVEVTDDPEPTDAPEIPTDAPEIPTDAPEIPTDAPVVPTEEPTEAPSSGISGTAVTAFDALEGTVYKVRLGQDGKTYFTPGDVIGGTKEEEYVVVSDSAYNHSYFDNQLFRDTFVPGSEYKVYVLVKAESGKPASIEVSSYHLENVWDETANEGAGGYVSKETGVQYFMPTSGSLTGTGNWELVELTGTVPADATDFRIKFTGTWWMGNPDYYFAGFAIKKDETAPEIPTDAPVVPTEAPTEEPALENNLLVNGSFADDMNGWSVGERMFYEVDGEYAEPYNWGYENRDNGDGTVDVYEGETLKYDNAIPAYVPQFYVSSDDSQDGDGKCMRPFIFGYADWKEMNQHITEAKPNTEYELTFYHKGDATLILELIDWNQSEGNGKIQMSESSADWTKYTMNVTTSDSPNLYVKIVNNSWPGAETYFDNFRLVEVVAEPEPTAEPTEAPVEQFVDVTAANVALNGTWFAKSFSEFSEGNAIRTDRANDTMEFTFEGRVLAINAYKSPTQGEIAVSIDGGAETIVDLSDGTYDSVMDVVYRNADLTDEEHTAVIRVVGGTVDAEGTIINSMATIDTVGTESGTVAATEVKSTAIQAEAAEGWNIFNHYAFNGKSAIKSTKATAEALEFVGTGKTVKIFGYKSTTQGTLHVKVTGSVSGVIADEDVNLYANTTDVDFVEVYAKTIAGAEELTVEITNAGGNAYVDYVEFVK